MTTTARPLIGASSKAAQWNAIKWQPLERQVQRLQMRIAKATRGCVESPGPVKRAFVRLEPCAVKVACTVLRGGNDGNVVLLPDIARSRDLIPWLDEPGEWHLIYWR